MYIDWVIPTIKGNPPVNFRVAVPYRYFPDPKNRSSDDYFQATIVGYLDATDPRRPLGVSGEGDWIAYGVDGLVGWGGVAPLLEIVLLPLSRQPDGIAQTVALVEG